MQNLGMKLVKLDCCPSLLKTVKCSFSPCEDSNCSLTGPCSLGMGCYTPVSAVASALGVFVLRVGCRLPKKSQQDGVGEGFRHPAPSPCCFATQAPAPQLQLLELSFVWGWCLAIACVGMVVVWAVVIILAVATLTTVILLIFLFKAVLHGSLSPGSGLQHVIIKLSLSARPQSWLEWSCLKQCERIVQLGIM